MNIVKVMRRSIVLLQLTFFLSSCDLVYDLLTSPPKDLPKWQQETFFSELASFSSIIKDGL